MTSDRLVPNLTREATLAQRVEQELEHLILESRLGAGDRLSSERELATQFGVSRTVVREAIVDEMRQHVDEPEVYIKSDVEFHAALARATQNELFVIVLDSLVEIMIGVRLLTLRVPDIARLALHYHERILEAVRAADPEAARAVMDEHMDQATAKLRAAVVSEPW